MIKNDFFFLTFLYSDNTILNTLAFPYWWQIILRTFYFSFTGGRAAPSESY